MRKKKPFHTTQNKPKMSCNIKKHTFGHMHPVKILISLHIRADWSKSSLGTFWIAKDAKFLHVDNEDSDQTVQMCRLIWVFGGNTSKVMFSPVAAQKSISYFLHIIAGYTIKDDDYEKPMIQCMWFQDYTKWPELYSYFLIRLYL